MAKIFIATPAYGGSVHAHYAIALAETIKFLSENGIETVIQIITSGTLLVAERNRLINFFLSSDATHMLCIDYDIGWQPETVKEFLDFDEEFIAGVYLTRKGREFKCQPKYNPDHTIVKSKKNLIEMEYVGSGFMLLKRSVFEKMIDKFPELEFKSDIPLFESGYCLFNTEVWEGRFWGEDYVFSRRARAAGVRIWVDPIVELDHAGEKGILMDALQNNNSTR
jgi:hypothetical protein